MRAVISQPIIPSIFLSPSISPTDTDVRAISGSQPHTRIPVSSGGHLFRSAIDQPQETVDVGRSL
jgi:hypothetical protein